MSNIHYFPGCHPEETRRSAETFFQPQRSSLARMLSIVQGADGIEAHIPDEATLAPFYGLKYPQSLKLPLRVMAHLSFSGEVTRLTLPNGRAFPPTWAPFARDPARGGLCHDRVVIKATWIGPRGNEPWAELGNPSGYVFGTLLKLCQELRIVGCELKLLKRLPVAYRTELKPEGEEINLLELTLAQATV